MSINDIIIRKKAFIEGTFCECAAFNKREKDLQYLEEEKACGRKRPSGPHIYTICIAKARNL
jgi:hypothetical protein